LDIRTVLAGTMRDGFRQVIDTLLSKKYPHHPHFDGTVSATRMEKIGALVDKLLDERDRRMNVERSERNDLRAYADPLGITETGDMAVVLNERPFKEIEQQRQQTGIDTPTVGNVRNWLDPQRTRGLPAEVHDVLISLYASWSGRTFRRDGKGYTLPRPGQLPDDVELLRPELPTQAEWTEALNRAGELFGVAIGGRSLGARNLSLFVDTLKANLNDVADAAELPAALEPKIRDWAELVDAPRLTTARASTALLQQLSRAEGAAIVRDLAGFTPETSLTAMGRNFTTAAASKRLLLEDARWIVLRQVKTLLGDPERGERAKLLLADLASLLATDEINKMLADGLGELTRRADDLLRVTTTKPQPPPPPPGEEVVLEASDDLVDAKAAASTLRELADRLEAEGKDASRISIRITAWRRRPE
jgi:hypothetical protein